MLVTVFCDATIYTVESVTVFLNFGTLFFGPMAIWAWRYFRGVTVLLSDGTFSWKVLSFASSPWESGIDCIFHLRDRIAWRYFFDNFVTVLYVSWRYFLGRVAEIHRSDSTLRSSDGIYHVTVLFRRSPCRDGIITVTVLSSVTVLLWSDSAFFQVQVTVLLPIILSWRYYLKYCPRIKLLSWVSR